MGKNVDHVQHIKSNIVVEIDGVKSPKLPNPSALTEGEIAINYAKDYETISLKNESGDVVTFSSDKKFYTKDEIDASEMATSAALNDLNRRKLDASAYTPSVDLWVSGTGENAIVQKNGGNTASGKLSVAMGSGTTASGDYSVAEGYQTSAMTYYSHSEGNSTKANGYSSHAEGDGTKASGSTSHAEGYSTSAMSQYSHAEGRETIANGYASHVEGWDATAKGTSSHAEGGSTKAIGNDSHAEGNWTTASGENSHAEGQNTKAVGDDSHAEGGWTTASGTSSHAEGQGTSATSQYSHAEGGWTLASGSSSHAEGRDTVASGNQSHAEGSGTTASGENSHAEGYKTTANNQSEHASGQFNISNIATTEFGDSGNTLFSVGNGTGVNAKHNAFEIRQNGDIYIVSGNSDIKLQDYIGGGGSITVDQVIDDTTSASTNPVSTSAVYSAMTDNELVWANAYVVLSGAISSHTVDTDVHVTAADKARWNSSSTSLWVSGTGENSIVQNGIGNTANGVRSVAEGSNTTANGSVSHTEGIYTETRNQAEHASGQFNSSHSATTEFGNSGNTLFSVGNGNGPTSRHNAFEIRQNGDIYITSGGTASSGSIKLQDTIGSKADKTSDLDGLKLKKITQAAYDALTTKDPNTLYVIVN